MTHITITSDQIQRVIITGNEQHSSYMLATDVTIYLTDGTALEITGGTCEDEGYAVIETITK